ncbi:hypothetical protein M3J09_006916, partial [Ascochyta lentis]
MLREPLSTTGAHCGLNPRPILCGRETIVVAASLHCCIVGPHVESGRQQAKVDKVDKVDPLLVTPQAGSPGQAALPATTASYQLPATLQPTWPRHRRASPDQRPPPSPPRHSLPLAADSLPSRPWEPSLARRNPASSSRLVPPRRLVPPKAVACLHSSHPSSHHAPPPPPHSTAPPPHLHRTSTAPPPHLHRTSTAPPPPPPPSVAGHRSPRPAHAAPVSIPGLRRFML